MLVVSSCLAGLKVRYNGSHSLHSVIERLVIEGKAITICPELLSGFSTPREPAEIIGGNGQDVLNGKARVVEKSGRDVTDMYLDGAEKTLELVKQYKATAVILKEYSPSCGSTKIYNGDFDGSLISGDGVTSALLRKHGIEVYSERNMNQLLESMTP
ncbi:DUF523 domain-containing protein [Bacillus sp. 31A1R]|uniref:DUF523 domain-containing protein n=1 Tax=Robertmurraya mangrovi TaxID=3098077 RepID=A0ABU5IW22_9BACI|nr:DUF523 domain-containing protein [Bacillus sp. 31A1R]MDZ5471337.1 DUF523 domain-containing protein [Bacillus sp. 31A1R]